ncbi:septin 2, variant 2 [Umbelopsis sp. WA50703]
MFLNAPEITKMQTYPTQIEEPSSFFSSVETSSKNEGISQDSDYEFEGMKEIFATTSQDAPLSEDQDDGDPSNVRPEYNICLIDTVGYGAYLDAGAIMSSVTSYLENQFQITNAIFNPMQANNHTLIKILNNDHGAYSHVDACLYLIYNRIKPVDLEYMRSLQHLCNIIPVVVKQAFYNTEQMNKRKYESLKELMDHDIDIFGFGHCKEELLEMCRRGNPGVPPFVVSFDDTDDRVHGSSSLDFESLKDMLFYKECNNLRSSTAQKFSKWRAAQFFHRGYNNDTLGDDLIPLREYPTIISSTLTTAETVDRMERVKQAEVKKVNLHIARFISEKRKEMEERMKDQEQQLKKEFETSSYKRRARILIAELAKLLIQSPVEQTQLTTSLPAQQKANKQKKSSQTPFHLIILKKLQVVPPEASKLIAACTLLILPFHFGPLVFFLSLCLFHCMP